MMLLTQKIHLIADSEIGTDLGFFNTAGTDAENDLRFIPHFTEQADLGILLEPGQHPRRMVVVKQLSAEFQIQFAVESRDPLQYMVLLLLHVQVIVKTDLHICVLRLFNSPFIIVRPPSGVNGVRQNFPPVCGFGKQAHGTACRILLQPSPSHSAALKRTCKLDNTEEKAYNSQKITAKCRHRRLVKRSVIYGDHNHESLLSERKAGQCVTRLWPSVHRPHADDGLSPRNRLGQRPYCPVRPSDAAPRLYGAALRLRNF